ncbi:MAG: glycosyltransferase [Actinomycetia bacterium]|nr:glycosyltransferase [Actinomycetes bacterium]
MTTDAEPDLRLQAVRDLLQHARWHEALVRARALVEQDARNPQAWVFLGEALEHLGRKHEAWLAYERAWVLDPPAEWVDAAKQRLFPLAPAPAADWLTAALRVPVVRVAAALIVRNEARLLADVLAAVQPAVDEIVVVDTGSNDATPDIARNAGARVFSYAWQDDFSAARNFALAQVQADWVLWVDGDEVLDPEDVGVPRLAAGLFDGLGEPVILRIVQVNKLGTRVEPNYDMSRMHPTRYGIRWWGRVHEQLGPPAGGVYARAYLRPVVRIRLHHDGYDAQTRGDKTKIHRNISLLRRSVEEDPHDVASWGFLGRELLLAGDVDAAIDALERAEQLAAGQPLYARVPEVRMYLGEALLMRQRLDEALAVAERAVAHHPDFPASWFLLGRVQLAQAVQLLHQAHRSFGQAQATALGYRGIVSVDSQIAQWGAAAGQADALKLLGDWVRARALYEDLLARHPELDPVRRQLRHMDEQITALRPDPPRTPEPAPM